MTMSVSFNGMIGGEKLLEVKPKMEYLDFSNTLATTDMVIGPVECRCDSNNSPGYRD